MGKFFTALHVKSNSKEQFIKEFTQLMKRDGYVPCSEDAAALSYAAAFSEGSWVTLSNGDDSTNELSKTAAKIAEVMETPCFTAEAVDSDFAILELHAPNGRTSRVVVGDGEGYGVKKAPFSTDDWKPLFQNQNGDIEKFLVAIGRTSTFVEDDLAEIGGLLGISGFAMTADYDEFSENEGAFNLSFKKAAEKKLSLNAAFKQVFGEALEPLGFKLIKSKYPYFVRVIGDEIVHVITYIDKASGMRTQKSFDILGGVATVYRKDLNLSNSPKDNLRWLSTLQQFYGKLNSGNGGVAVSKFEYADADEILMCNEIECSLEITKQVILPVLNETIDLESCIKYFYRFQSPLMNITEDEFENKNPNHFCYEGLLLVKTKNRDNGEELMKHSLAEVKKMMVDGKIGLTQSEFEKQCELHNKGCLQQNAIRNKLLDTPELYKKTVLELEQRKNANIQVLISYGLIH
ncbi:MAG: hypothetical protein NC299_12995 [Lachnospiraceae bacterium]|nr:hypothetical protein [Ruminococcus sp.]MCM1276255.1 hypothetical protein [Lachnospiraceae bacterium]